LVTHSLAEYEARALLLARDPSALAEVKEKLLRNRTTQPLFDTARFTRHLETAYTRMMERHRGGEPPMAFAVDVLENA
jgi:protein O-GlcNAc transferase